MRIVLVLIVLFYSCKKDYEKLGVWEKIKAETKVNNVDYLLEISADTLACVECNNGNSKVEKKTFYNKYFTQMDVIKNSNYTFFTEKINIGDYNKRHRIGYSISNKETRIYTVLEGSNGILFLGVFSVP